MKDNLKKNNKKKLKTTQKKIWKKMKTTKKNEKKWKTTLKKKWKTNQSTKINLIGCDTIVNSPSWIIISPYAQGWYYPSTSFHHISWTICVCTFSLFNTEIHLGNKYLICSENIIAIFDKHSQNIHKNKQTLKKQTNKLQWIKV